MIEAIQDSTVVFESGPWRFLWGSQHGAVENVPPSVLLVGHWRGLQLSHPVPFWIIWELLMENWKALYLIHRWSWFVCCYWKYRKLFNISHRKSWFLYCLKYGKLCKRRGCPYGWKVNTTAYFYKVFFFLFVTCHLEVETPQSIECQNLPFGIITAKEIESEPDVYGVAFSRSPACSLHVAWKIHLRLSSWAVTSYRNSTWPDAKTQFDHPSFWGMCFVMDRLFFCSFF